MIIVGASVAAYIFLESGSMPFSLIGKIPPGIPSFQSPPFSLYDSKTNKTYTVSDMASVRQEMKLRN